MVILRRYTCEKGGRFGLESVAGMKWNQWPTSNGIGGRNELEYASNIKFKTT